MELPHLLLTSRASIRPAVTAPRGIRMGLAGAGGAFWGAVKLPGLSEPQRPAPWPSEEAAATQPVAVAFMAEKQVFPVGLACGMWGLSCFCAPRRLASTLGKLVLSVSRRSCKDAVTSQSVPVCRPRAAGRKLRQRGLGKLDARAGTPAPSVLSPTTGLPCEVGGGRATPLGSGLTEERLQSKSLQTRELRPQPVCLFWRVRLWFGADAVWPGASPGTKGRSGPRATRRPPKVPPQDREAGALQPWEQPV